MDVPSPPLQRLLLAGLVIAAVAVAIASNWALLSYADKPTGNVGNLSPKASLAPLSGHPEPAPGPISSGGDRHADD